MAGGSPQESAYLHICINCMEEKGENPVCKHCGYDERKFEQHPSYLKPRTFLNNARYILGKNLGGGGFGTTYIGFDTVLSQKVVIKEYFPSVLVTRDIDRATVIPLNVEKSEFFREGVKLFTEEARMVAKFSQNAHIVNVYDCFEGHGTGYIVMDFLEGDDLAAFLKKKGGKIPLGDAQQIVFPLLDALKEVHSKKLYHRDISPQNIIFTPDTGPVLIDFGAARYVVDEQSRSLDIVVKPGYSPLEQYSSAGKIGAWTDVYACGATLYQMITGEIPPPALDRLGKDDLQPPSRILPELPQNISKKKLDDAILHALAVRIEDRFQTVDEFKAALISAASNGKQQKERRKWILLIVGLAILSFILGASYQFLPGVQTFVHRFVFIPTPAPTVTPAFTPTPFTEKFHVGDRVRLKEGVEWSEGIKAGDIGTVNQVDGDLLIITFDSGNSEIASSEDVEKVP